MSGIRNAEWMDDADLKEKMRSLVLQNFRRAEIVDFLERDFPQYAWSLPTLSRRLQHFGIRFINYDTTLSEVRGAFATQINGPGQLLGYRAMHKQIREHHGLAVPRGLVYDVMSLDDPEGLEKRKTFGKQKRKRGPVGTFTSLVINIYSLTDLSTLPVLPGDSRFCLLSPGLLVFYDPGFPGFSCLPAKVFF